MSILRRTQEFFVAGGTLGPNAVSYVKRDADDELFDLLLAGKFCYVLTTRQMGKSSLMIRVARRLKRQGVRTALIDLTGIGTTASVEQWYLSLVESITNELQLSIDIEAWWLGRAWLGTVKRFITFLREVVLQERDEQVVIFIDEIDSALHFDFSDDFFAGIRSIYNARAQEPNFERLTFVLLGTTTPSDLIKDYTRTPFNIGERLLLPDFTLTEAKVLQDGLEKSYLGQGETIFRQLYQWTNGHPYLTQKLCHEVVKAKQEDWCHGQIEGVIKKTFLSELGPKDANLQFVRDRILAHPQQRNLLSLYKKVYESNKIRHDPQSILQNQLKLSGLVKAEDGYLQIRNKIYRMAFNSAWIKRHTPIDWTPVIAVTAVVVMLFLFSLLLFANTPIN